MLHRSTHFPREMPQLYHPAFVKGIGNGSNASKPSKVLWFRCYLVVAAIILITLHLHLIFMMNRDLQGQEYLYHSEDNQKFVDVNHNMNRALPLQESKFTPTPPAQCSATFNNIPIQRVDGTTPKETTVECVSPKISSENLDKQDKYEWMYRTCEYKNLCFDTSLRQYIAITTKAKDDAQDHEFPSVSIGGINPRWINTAKNKTTQLFDIYNSDIRKVQWRPKMLQQQPKDLFSSTSSYYRMKDEYIFIPFHSMAGHNVGHLIWDDLYAIYTALRLRNYIDPNDIHSNTHRHQNQKFLLLRHVLEESNNNDSKLKQQPQPQLYANCDIRRNKRIQCKENFERFLPLFGNTNVQTFYTSKTSQLNVINHEATKNINLASTSSSTASASLVCFDKTIVGIGLLTDHGWNDHGWESPSSLLEVDPPHNLGRGRLFYDFTQYLVRNQLATPRIASTKNRVWIPQITFSIESSRDWSRRLNFTNQITALNAIPNDKRSSIHRDFVVQSYRMYELSLSEQIDVAMQTNIFVSVCGGGSMTTTFLPRNAVVIFFYDPHGGHDYYNNNVHPNTLPARLDWDLLNNAAHVRVHWLPISEMDTPDHIELFLRLVRHELTMIHSMRTT
jgi:hypothetical protein